jgi:vacuolar-type H+-ATPase subunit I/STV1
MLKSEIYNLEDNICALEETANNIERILTSESYLGQDISESLFLIYKKRDEIINKLVFKLKESGIVGINIDSQTRINAVLDKDKRNLDLIGKNVKDLSDKLRKLIKQKSLLIYTKDRRL